MMSRIAHHTSGDTSPLIPVHENALFGAATSLAPRFKRSSETNTKATLKLSCSHGLPMPDGRFGVFLFVLSSVMSSEVETCLTVTTRCAEAKITPEIPRLASE